MSRTFGSLRLLAYLSGIALLVSGAARAQTSPPGSITGTVVDASSHAAVASARVRLSGTSTSVLTSASGQFTLTANEGSWKFIVTKTGYLTVTSGYVTVTSGAATNVGNVPFVALGALSGTVTRSDTGALLSGVTASTSPGTAKANSSSKGIFTVYVQAGTYSVTLRKTGFLSKQLGSFTVVGTGTTNVGSASLVPTDIGTVTGTVKAADTQKPLSGATVTLHADSYFTAKTNSSGVFTIKNVPVGAQVFDVAKSDYGSVSVNATVATGTDTLPDTLLPHLTGTITGTIVDVQAGNAPLSGALVTVLKTTPAITATTGPDGTFSLPGVLAGSVTIKVTRTSYVSKSKAVKVAGSQTVTAGTLALDRTTVSITGIVTIAPTKTAIVGAVLALKEQPTVTAVSATNGTYTLRKARWGSVTLTASAVGYVSVSLPLTLPAGVTTKQNIPLTALPSGGTITGTVLDGATGFRLAGAAVHLTSNPGISTSSDASGNFSLANVPPGSQTVDVSLSGYANLRSGSVVVPAGGSVSAGNLSLSASPASLTGTVTDGSGAPLSGVTVTAAISGRTTTTNASGTYSISNLSPGYEVLVFQTPTYATYAMDDVNLDPGTTTTVYPVGMYPPSTTGQGVLQGFVRDSAGNPISGATVSAVGITTATSAPDGSWAISAPSDSYIVLTAEAAGFRRTAAPPAGADLDAFQVRRDFTLYTSSQKGSVTVATYDPTTQQPAPGPVVIRSARAVYSVQAPVTLSSVDAGPIYGPWTQLGTVSPGGAITLNLDGAYTAPPNAFVIAGTAFDLSTLAGIPGATIQIQPQAAGSNPVTVVADARGRYTYSGSAAGDYCVLVAADGYVYNGGLGCITVQASDLGVTVYSGWDFSLTRPESLTISSPASGTTLTGSLTSLTCTAALAPGDYVVGTWVDSNAGINSAIPTYSLDGRTITFAIDASLPTNTSMDVTVTAYTTFGSIQATATYPQPGGSIRGRVVDGASGTPQPGVTINLRTGGPPGIRAASASSFDAQTITGDDGTFTFAVPPGSYNVSTSADGWMSASTYCNVPSNGSVDVGDLQIYRMSSVTGRVVSAIDSSPVAGATVDGGMSQATTGADGSFTLAVSPGPFSFWIYDQPWWQDTMVSGTVDAGGSASAGTIALTPYGAVAGTVTDATTGTAIANANVYDEESGAMGWTDPNGTFTITSLLAGLHHLHASATGGYADIDKTCTVAPLATTTVSIALHRSGGIHGRVLGNWPGPGPLPLSGVYVKADTGENALSSSDGTFLLNVTGGLHSITLSLDSWSPATRSGISVTTGATAEVGDITLTKWATINGVVVDSGTASIEGATITLSGSAGISTTSAADGTFTLYADPSPHTLTVTAAGFLSKTVQVASGGPLVAGQVYSLGYVRLTHAITQDTTWHRSDSPIVISDLAVAPCVTLTIEPGVEVRVRPGTTDWLRVQGTLIAVGTPDARITFTSDAPSPARNDWYGLSFEGTSCSGPSRLTYADVRYTNYSLVVNPDSLPLVDHVLFSDATSAGLYGPTGVRILNSTFLRIPMLASGAAGTLDASLNYWGAADGPSGDGPGSGTPVGHPFLGTSDPTYEPWLAASPTDSNYITSAVIQHQLANPAAGIVPGLTFTTKLAGPWNITLQNATHQVVRTLSGEGATASATWDGLDETGAAVPAGTYVYTIAATSTDGGAFAAAAGRLYLYTAPPQVSVSPSTDIISPTSTTGKTTTNIQASLLPYLDATITITLSDPSGGVVRSVSGVGTTTLTWDGTDPSGHQLPDGRYGVAVTATDGSLVATGSSYVILDATPPRAEITSPRPGDLISNFYGTGSSLVIIGTADDGNPDRWGLDSDLGHTIGITNGVLETWDTLTLPNGPLVLHLTVRDRAGNVSETTVQVNVGNFAVDLQQWEANIAAGNNVSYTARIPGTLHYTLSLKSEAGIVVRTLFDGVRNAGTYTDVWDGTGIGGGAIPDGPYFYTANLTDGGTHSMTWDLSNEFWPASGQWFDPPGLDAPDPFNNKPLTFTYNFGSPGRVTVVMARTCCDDLQRATCTPPNFCLQNMKFEPSGPHTVQWAVVDASGVFRSDLCAVNATLVEPTLPKNGVLLFGRTPLVSNVRVDPPYYWPEKGSQTVSFDLATPGGQPVTTTVTFLWQGSSSVLRTIQTSNQTAGHLTVSWDGKAGNGLPVIPGAYTVTVTATDVAGDSFFGQILTTVAY